MDKGSPARDGQESEPHLDWCRRSYVLADGSTWQDPYDCHEDYAGPDAQDYCDIESLLMEGAPQSLLPYLYRAMADIAGEDWARHSLVWTLRLDTFAGRTAFVASATAPYARN